MSDAGLEHNEQHLEPTIAPVRRPVAAEGATDSAPRSSWRFGLTGLAILLAVAGVVAVFVYLPAWVERSEPAPESAPVTSTVPVEAVPELSAEEIAALTEQAESLLIELQGQGQELNARSAASWGDTTWSAYETAARLGDEAFIAEDLVEAVDQYQAALAMGDTLLARSRSIMDEALAAGDEALASGNAEIAASQFALVLAVDPENARATRGLARAASLPDVLEAMRRGDELEQQGALERAAEAYREASRIDPDFQAARAALAATNTRIADARFDRLIDEGFAAIEAGRNARAAEVFADALAIRPQSEAARSGLAEAEQGQLLDAIALAEIRARAFEARELWDEAIARYREALATDATLTFAIEGLARSRARADLDVKLQAIIDSPRQLFDEAVLEDSRRLLAQARAVAEPGPRIGAQTEQLAELIELAMTPIKVTFVSDGATVVTVYRVGELGSFASREVELKPGNYTAVGYRNGYRDVRETFTVLPGRDPVPVSVVCVEEI